MYPEKYFIIENTEDVFLFLEKIENGQELSLEFKSFNFKEAYKILPGNKFILFKFANHFEFQLSDESLTRKLVSIDLGNKTITISKNTKFNFTLAQKMFLEFKHYNIRDYSFLNEK